MNLADIRKAKHLTQEEVARTVSISRVAYTNIENGKRNPSPKVAKRIASVLGIPWTIFFESEEDDDDA